MQNFLARGRSYAGVFARMVRKNVWMLFLLAFLLGGGVKLIASEYVTMGYNDYIAERHSNIDFAALQREAKAKQQESPVNTNTQQ